MVTQPNRSIAALLVAISLGFVGFFTLRPEEASVVLPTTCVFCGNLGGTDFILNIILFIPLGVSLRWLTRRVTTALAVGGATTILIEALQWGAIHGRYASLGDLLANTLGTAIGAWLAVQLIAVLNSSPERARSLCTPFAGFVSIVVFATAMLIQPALPRKPSVDVQWTPVRRNTMPFPGRLLSVSLNDLPLRPAQRISSSWLFDSANRSMEVRARVTSAGTPQRRAIIVRTANATEEGFMIAQDREQLVFRSTVFAERLKLRPLEIGLEQGRQTAPESDSLTEIVAHSSSGAMSLFTGQAGNRREVTLKRTVGLGWAVLSPYEVALKTSWWGANAVWLGALIVPLAFLLSRSASRPDTSQKMRLPWRPPMFVLASLVVWPLVFGLSQLGPGELFGVAAGAGLGILIERWTTLHRGANANADTRTQLPELQ